MTDGRIPVLLQILYGSQSTEVLSGLQQIMDRYKIDQRPYELSEQDMVLITYPDIVREANSPALAALKSFMDQYLSATINTVHLLPFFPYTSDDGFSVSDYYSVDPSSGTWDHIKALGTKYRLMFDFVINHISSKNDWFLEYLNGNPQYAQYFIAVDPDADVSKVIRPRNYPLLTSFQSAQGVKPLWTTFSADQIDLNFQNPNVLLKMVDVMLFYVQSGASLIRLDAIAYLWKNLDTPCINHPNTHNVVKLLRAILDEVAPHVHIITETNVPHSENISYLGSGYDEAHLVYQFTLPPLLLHAFVSGNASHLSRWAASLEASSSQASFFNFTASHDGIGVRPLENILDNYEINRLVETVKLRHGMVSNKTNPDGTLSPYELNITYYSALQFNDNEEDTLTIAKFLASQAVMLSMQGIPGIYFHSLFGTPNNLEGMTLTGQPRTINRRKFLRQEIDEILSDAHSVGHRIFYRYLSMLQIRRSEPSFHPNIPQKVLDIHPGVFALQRANLLCLTNLSDRALEIDAGNGLCMDILNKEQVGLRQLQLAPYQARWIKR